MCNAGHSEIAFGRFGLDLTNECLRQGTRAIALRAKAFAVLKVLLEHSGQLVDKQQVEGEVDPCIMADGK